MLAVLTTALHARALQPQQAHALQAPPTSTGFDLGVCMTGLPRSVLSPPMIISFNNYIRPLGAELHMTVIVSNATSVSLREAIQTAWSPESLSFMPAEGPNFPYNPRCDINSSVHTGLIAESFQWLGLHQCYTQIHHAEVERGRQYDWLLRTRTDLVPLEPLPLGMLDPAYAYVPLGGFSPYNSTMCMNDHVFVCPRHLCRPYFELLELWRSPFCNASVDVDAPGGPPSIFATYDADGALVPNGIRAPSEPFLMPELRRRHIQQHFLARYEPEERLCDANGLADQRDPSCCGLVREFLFHYTIARGNADAGILECGYTLDFGWRRGAPRTAAHAAAFEACHAQSDVYARNMTRSTAIELCDPLPDDTIYESLYEIPIDQMPPPELLQHRRFWCFGMAARIGNCTIGEIMQGDPHAPIRDCVPGHETPAAVA